MMVEFVLLYNYIHTLSKISLNFGLDFVALASYIITLFLTT